MISSHLQRRDEAIKKGDTVCQLNCARSLPAFSWLCDVNILINGSQIELGPETLIACTA